MRYEQGNIFEIAGDGQAICIPVNGSVDEDGNAMMDSGLAKIAVERYGQKIRQRLGECVKTYGNRAFILGNASNISGTHFVLSYPTKNDYREKSANVSLICKSGEQIEGICTKYNITKCYLPKVGCGSGKLDWENTVEPWLSQMLDDRFVVVTLEAARHDDDGKMHLIVSGLDGFDSYERFAKIMDEYLKGIKERVEIVSGGTNTVDTFAQRYGQVHGLELKVFRPQKELYGDSANGKRTAEMHDYLSSFGKRACIYVWDGKSEDIKEIFRLSEDNRTPLSVYNCLTEGWLN